MNKLSLIETKELNSIADIDSFQDELYIAEIDGETFKNAHGRDFSVPIRMNALLIVITIQGESSLGLDYVPYNIGANQLIMILPSHMIQMAQVSEDFKALLLVVSPTFVDGYIDKKRPSMVNYLKIRKNPCNLLSGEEVTFLSSQIQSIRKNMRRRTHIYYKEVLQNGFLGLMLEVANILAEKQEGLTMPTLSRKEEILNEYLQLLFINCKEQHQVAFYADKLCISPQYLSLVLKEQTGKSASKWIDEVLITEAKILLKTPNATVQQVANDLNFSDQSTFGKFFKKHMKVSPLEYRKS